MSTPTPILTGDVTLYHGDCLAVLASLPDGSVDAVVTDPPYGIDYQSAWRTDKSAWLPKIAGDKEPCLAWLPDAFRLLKDGGGLACFCAWKTQQEFRDAIEAAGFKLRSQVIWDRDSHGMGDLEAEFAPQHDVIWFATKGDGFKFAAHRPKSILRHMRVAPGALAHPNEKPLRLLVSLVRPLCPERGTILDPFAGSGTTAVAYLKTGRKCISVEIDDRYIPIIKRRVAEAATPLLEGLAS